MSVVRDGSASQTSTLRKNRANKPTAVMRTLRLLALLLLQLATVVTGQCRMSPVQGDEPNWCLRDGAESSTVRPCNRLGRCPLALPAGFAWP